MRFDQLHGIPFTDLDGAPCPAERLVGRRTVLLLIDAHRARVNRTAAEVAWVRERLDPEVDLVLVWPRGTATRARHFPDFAGLRSVEDANSDFRRLVSPTGKRIAILADPALGSLQQLTAESPLFDVGHTHRDTDGRGADRTIDLGDMHL